MLCAMSSSWRLPGSRSRRTRRCSPCAAVCRSSTSPRAERSSRTLPRKSTRRSGHQIDTPLYAIAHEVWVARGSALSNVMQEQLADGEVLQVNSRHHQAVKQTAPGFDVCATAPDGIIEAIERPNSRFCIAVQWHPENFWRTGEFRSLFEEFVKASTQHP